MPGISWSSCAELARPPVVVGEPVDERVERDECRRRRDPGLVHARPAEPAQHRLAPARSPPRGRRGSPPSARRGPCSADRHRVRGRGELRDRDAEGDRRVEEPRPSRWTRRRGAWPRRASAAVSSGDSTVPPARVCVFSSTSISAPVSTIASSTSAGSSRPSSAQSDHGSRPAISSIPIASEVRTCEEASRTTCSPRRERQQRDEVGHPAGRHPGRGRLAEQRGHPLASTLTEASSPNVAQPSSALRIASHISSVGTEQRSERRSIIGAAGDARVARPCARRRRRRGRR